jgi:hypothetical protein
MSVSLPIGSLWLAWRLQRCRLRIRPVSASGSDPVIETAPVDAERVGGVKRRPLGEQGGELDPQRLDKPSRDGRHGRSSFSIT